MNDKNEIWNEDKEEKVLSETFLKLEAIVNVKTSEIEKYECLVRHNDYIPPVILKNISNERLFLKQLKDISKLVKEKDIKVSINIDNNVLKSQRVYDELSKYPKNILKNIEFEILETNIDLKSLEIFSKRIENLGIKVNIDDFGSEEQTMERVKDIHDIVGKKLKSIKLDASVVKGYCEDNPKMIKNVKEVRDYALKNNITIIAEHIENINKFEKIKEVSDYVQGYMFDSLYSNLKNIDSALDNSQKNAKMKLKNHLLKDKPMEEKTKKKSKRQ